eukprot:TRINITY_DN5724_c0_g1_i1.p1 TRINITY_DN5724_c0_g1~~TRINITY_DN5724_c0_g1_i1.p1  ORF type:complete len:270 (+),score=67.17 TRINITY_DN5724_c0_g1_i1:298-1107(+)
MGYLRERLTCRPCLSTMTWTTTEPSTTPSSFPTSGTSYPTECREPLNEKRMAAIEKIYMRLDFTDSGKIRLSSIMKRFSVEKHPDFISGKKSRDELIKEFLSNFPGAQKNGFITKEEFFDYYTEISTPISSDEYFIGILGEDWPGLADGDESALEDEGAAAAEDEEEEDPKNAVPKERVDELVKTLRLKLCNLTKTQDEYFLRKLFHDIDMDKSGFISPSELLALLCKLGITTEPKYAQALFKRFDKNDSGTIDLEEFCTFIINSPYTR